MIPLKARFLLLLEELLHLVLSRAYQLVVLVPPGYVHPPERLEVSAILFDVVSNGALRKSLVVPVLAELFDVPFGYNVHLLFLGLELLDLSLLLLVLSVGKDRLSREALVQDSLHAMLGVETILKEYRVLFLRLSPLNLLWIRSKDAPQLESATSFRHHLDVNELLVEYLALLLFVSLLLVHWLLLLVEELKSQFGQARAIHDQLVAFKSRVGVV